jgi:hypothetical protein
MLWIVALAAAWLGACLMAFALASIAARADRPTADHLARMRRSGVWLPPQPERDRPLL